MTHSGGKPHNVGYQGQQYEVSIYDDGANGRMVVGWTNDGEKARQLADAAELRPGWSAAWVTDLLSDISHTMNGKWIGERPLPAMTQTNDTESRARFEAQMLEAAYAKPERSVFSDDAYMWERDQDRFVGWSLRDAEVAAKDERIVDLECNIGTYRSIVDEKNNDIAALAKRKNEAEYESASWKRQLDTLREQHAAHTARVIESAILACEAVRDMHGAHDNDAAARGAVQCVEAIRALNADQIAKEAQS